MSESLIVDGLPSKTKESFIEKHTKFVSTVYIVTFYFMSFYAFIMWLVKLFNTAREDNVLGFIFVFIMSTIIQAITAFIGTAIWGTIALVVLFIPYLVIRGFVR